MTEMVLPQFGMGMADGTIIAWHKAEGDRIEAGEPLCDVEAAKTTVEVAAPLDGILQRILVPAGANVPVNTVIALIGDIALARDHGAAGVSEVAHPAEPQPVALAADGVVAPVTQIVAPPVALSDPRRGDRATQIEPRARRAARVHGVDLSLVEGTGPGGRIIESDILNATRKPPAAPAPAAAANPAGKAATHPASRHGPESTTMRQLHLRCDAQPLLRLLEQLPLLDGGAVPLEAALLRATALAGAQRPSATGGIGLRTDAGDVRVVDAPAGLSLSAIARQLDAAANLSGPLPSLIIEWHREAWLHEVASFDRLVPACLSFGPLPALDATAGDDWAIVLTITEAGPALAEAKHLLQSLHDLLDRPLAILA